MAQVNGVTADEVGTFEARIEATFALQTQALEHAKALHELRIKHEERLYYQAVDDAKELQALRIEHAETEHKERMLRIANGDADV